MDQFLKLVKINIYLYFDSLTPESSLIKHEVFRNPLTFGKGWPNFVSPSQKNSFGLTFVQN